MKSVTVTQVQRSHQHHHESLVYVQKKSKKDWKTKKDEKNKKEKRFSLEPKPILFNLNSNSNKQSSNYSLSHKINFMSDSGATSHFVNDRKLLTKFKEDTEYIKMAVNSETNCDGYGNLFLTEL